MTLVKNLRFTQQENVADAVEKHGGVTFLFQNANGSFSVVWGPTIGLFRTV